MASLTLYAIEEHLAALMDSIDLCETEEARAECDAEICRTIEAEIRKVDDFCRFRAHLQSQEGLADKEIERLKARKTGFAKLAERLDQYAIRVMQSMNLKKLDGNTSRLTLRTNQPALEVTNEELVPAQYKTIEQIVHVDKMAIKRAIGSGEEVPGAHLREPSVSLIRT